MSFSFVETALAQTSGLSTNTGSVERIGGFEVFDLVHTGIAWALIIAAFLSVIFIFIGGISFILSGGQEDKVKQAVSTIRYAIVGLIITILAITVVAFVGRMFGIDLVFIKFEAIIQQISDIVANLSQTSGTSTGGGSSAPGALR